MQYSRIDRHHTEITSQQTMATTGTRSPDKHGDPKGFQNLEVAKMPVEIYELWSRVRDRMPEVVEALKKVN